MNDLFVLNDWTENVFCATGPGGGIDPTCKKTSINDLEVHRGGSLPESGPVFLTTDKAGAGEYGQASSYRVTVKNPLVVEDIGSDSTLVKAAKEAGLDVRVFPEGDVHIPLLEVVSPSGQGNHLPDLVYIPSVLSQLKSMGFDGLRFRDPLWEEHIDTIVAFDPGQVTPNK